MLSSFAVLDMFSAVFCVMVAEEPFCVSSIVGLNLSKKFFSSTDVSEVAVILTAGEPNAALETQMGRITGLTHKNTIHQ